MDPADSLTERFHFGGDFVRSKNRLRYVGGTEGISVIERDKVYYPELKGHLADHVAVKRNVKLHWLWPGKVFEDGLMFLHDDSGCLRMSNHITDGGVADVYVELNTNESDSSGDSGSSYGGEEGSSDFNTDEEIEDFPPDNAVITADEDDVQVIDLTQPGGNDFVVVPDDDGVITQVFRSPSKKMPTVAEIGGSSQAVVTGSSQVLHLQDEVVAEEDVAEEDEEVSEEDDVEEVPAHGEIDSSSSDSEYQPLSDDSDEYSETEELRRHAKMYKKKIRASQRFVSSRSSGAVPIDLVANVEEAVMDSEFPSDDEGYSYDEASDAEDGHYIRRKSKFPIYDSKSDVPHFSLSMVFSSKQQMKKALKKYGLVTKRSIVFLKSEEERIRAKCGWPGCPWLIYAAKRSRCSKFQVITYKDEHHCAQNRLNKLVTAQVIANMYENFLMANPTWKIESIRSTVLQEMFADVSASKCKKAKKIVMDKLFTGMKGEYTKVFDYQLELLRSNPGSTVAVMLDPENREEHIFQRFYVCFDALKKGFKAGCRRVIGLDGCFFKGACQGELICAIGRDANNQMYPVAWAVVEQETTENWLWFLGLPIKDLDINDDGAGWVFISDQQKGLLNSMKAYLPRAEHRMCARHIYANWRKKYRDIAWQKKFWAIAKAGNREDFMYHKAKLALETPDGAKDIMKTEPKHWARAFFAIGSKCDSVNNNLCESFNHAIVDARFFPIISMLEKIRGKMMIRIQERRAKWEKWHGVICPNIFKKLKVSIKMTANCDVLWNGKDGFEVRHSSGRGRRYTVNLEKKICSCGYFQLAGLPCCHAIAAIYKCGRQVDEFIDKCFYIDEFKKTYEHCMEPVEGEDRWPISQNPRPKPPAYVRMPGRPKQNNRKREDHEKPKGSKMTRVGIQMRCSVCHKTGHNKISCLKKKEMGRNTNAFIAKAGKNIKAAEQSQSSQVSTVKGKGKNQVAEQGQTTLKGRGKKQVSEVAQAGGSKRKRQEGDNVLKEKMAKK